jgi:hypothetical protein
MKIQHLTVALTVINLVMLALIFVRLRPTVADQGIPQVLRGHSLEIIDVQGRVRSQILVTEPTTMPDGKSYPEGTLFRLIDPNGRPAVKIGGSADGSAISLAGDSERRDWSGVQILAEGASSSVKLTNKDGRQEIVTPK